MCQQERIFTDFSPAVIAMHSAAGGSSLKEEEKMSFKEACIVTSENTHA